MDTNVWSFVAEQGREHELRALAAESGWILTVAPITIIEAAKTADPGLRRAILSALTTRGTVHLRTEAQMEGAEFVAEANRVRPEWVRKRPRNLLEVARLEKFWTHRVPQRAKYDPDLLGDPDVHDDRAIRDVELASQSFTQRELRGSDRPLDPTNLQSLSAYLSPNAPSEFALGFDGPIEAWRASSAGYYWAQLAHDANFGRDLRRDTTMADWIDPFIDLHAVRADRLSFNVFWYRDVDRAAMVRNWLRWAAKTAQLAFRLGKGNAYDAANASYFPDYDVYLTSDRRFFLTSEKVIAQSPVAMPRLGHVDRSAKSAVQAIAAALPPAPIPKPRKGVEPAS
jgi:hypothetical protein